MNSTILDALLDSPVLPELMQAAHAAWERERKLRHKFYADITPEHKWEFIQGEVIMHSPALNRHLIASQNVFKLLDIFVCTRRLGMVRHEKAMTSFPRNDYEPDVMFFGLAKLPLIDHDTLRFPIPDLIVEVISPSTEKRDRGIKFQDYALHGVGEYWIIDTVAETIEVYRLPSGADAYPPAEKLSTGTFSSEVVPGFEVPVRAIFDEAENLAALRSLMASS
jgi:Uma2 family endonuclease